MVSAAAVRKTVSVVFCDLAGSTALGERLDPEPLRELMGAWYEAMRTAVERHGGTVEKFIGDAVMAVFGVPQVHEDDALRAVRAAVEMQAAAAALGAGLGIRVGVNTGEVVTGDAATTLVTGDAVNTAKRLEEAAGEGEILIGAVTRRLVAHATRLEPVDAIAARGNARPSRRGASSARSRAPSRSRAAPIRRSWAATPSSPHSAPSSTRPRAAPAGSSRWSAPPAAASPGWRRSSSPPWPIGRRSSRAAASRTETGSRSGP